MFLSASTPRRSFSIPVNINLQGARRRQGRELFQAGSPQELDWNRGLDAGGGQPSRAQLLVPSVGEDRAILLGFSMMAFSVLMLFLVGVTTVKPYLGSDWEEAGCVLLGTEILEEWVECRGVSTVPCLRVTVNLTGSNQTALLHLDEDLVLRALECFYIPKCRMGRAELQKEVEEVKSSLDAQLVAPSSCLTDHSRHPRDAILNRKYTHSEAALALLWPGLLLGGGALLVVLVKLTQYLARLSAEACSGAAGGRLEGKQYRLLRGSGTPPPS
ncbi:calcium-activated potassium channel subunit beta-3 isoform X2 [Takifugu rubripes]|uniref:Potassium calcium-activated channel subfamily M regulatory beta subunit 3 n=1 Tax=Takifugu rubripes TaxID=31033 RepID=A0A674NZM6_TAKRU|nr:calcium-activated potassium channel subunit beta-3-like isoform X2 [Takifugu rubripes]